MTFAPRFRSRVVSVALTALVVGVGTTAASAPAPAAPRPTPPPAGPPAVVGYPPVAAPRAATPTALPRLPGSVPLRPTKVAPAAGRATAPATRPARTAATTTTTTTTATTTAAATRRVGLRALVIAVDAADFGLPTWRTVLDRAGAAYDVLLTRQTPLTAPDLLRPDGAGRYNAILLTSASLLYADDAGNYVSGLDPVEWNLLWSYERDFAVRQVALYASHGTWPEDYCLRPVSEGGIGDTPLTAALTSAGAGVFDQLRGTATIPLVRSYVYRTGVAAGCAATPLLTTGTDVLGVTSTSTDGRERLALTFTSNQYLLHTDLLGYGLLRWASRGLFLGEQRHFLNVDVDDWFADSDHYLPDGTIAAQPYRVTARELVALTATLAALRLRYPQAAALRPSLAYNGGAADLTAGSACGLGGAGALTATSRCLRGQYRWLNHTVSHPELNTTDHATTLAEVDGNLTIAATLGLPVDRAVLKTPEYSGLGVYNPDPDNDIDPPTDFGLGAANPALLAVAAELGVRYLHGNMSFPSHVPACFNCATPLPVTALPANPVPANPAPANPAPANPVPGQPQVLLVPDWPTNIAYHTTTPAEQTAFYNSFYGPGGRFPYWLRNLTYDELMSYETDLALRHLTSGSVNTHTFHIANTHAYGLGRTLLTDWLGRLLAKYTSYYRVPLLSPAWSDLGARAEARTRHAAQLTAGVDAVYDPAAGAVTVGSPLGGTVTVSGARGAGATTYGAEVSTTTALTAGTPVILAAVLRG